MELVQCAMCLEPMSGTSAKTETTICSHMFHTECLQAWLRVKHTCPCCRTVLREDHPFIESFSICSEEEEADYMELPDEMDVSDSDSSDYFE